MVDIIIVDDEEDICEILTALFEDAEYSVRSAYNAKDAEELITKLRPPLIICDITMPGKSGLELVQSLKSDKISGAIVMLTAHSESEKIIQALQLGAVDYLVKPFNSRDVVDRVQGWVEIGKRLQSCSNSRLSDGETLSKQLRMIELFRLQNHKKHQAI